MNKKQMIKEQKRIKQEQKEVANLFQDDKEVYNVFKIAFGVILFIGLAYVCLNIFNGNWKIFTKTNIPTEEIDEKMLIVGTMFNKEDGEYLVLVYDMKDESQKFYGALTQNYYSAPNLYYIDLSSGFNEKFISDKTVVSNDLNKIKFNGAVLLLINKDKITKSYTTEIDIVNYFNTK